MIELLSSVECTEGRKTGEEPAVTKRWFWIIKAKSGNAPWSAPRREMLTQSTLLHKTQQICFFFYLSLYSSLLVMYSVSVWSGAAAGDVESLTMLVLTSLSSWNWWLKDKKKCMCKPVKSARAKSLRFPKLLLYKVSLVIWICINVSPRAAAVIITCFLLLIPGLFIHSVLHVSTPTFTPVYEVMSSARQLRFVPHYLTLWLFIRDLDLQRRNDYLL